MTTSFPLEVAADGDVVMEVTVWLGPAAVTEAQVAEIFWRHASVRAASVALVLWTDEFVARRDRPAVVRHRATFVHAPVDEATLPRRLGPSHWGLSVRCSRCIADTVFAMHRG